MVSEGQWRIVHYDRLGQVAPQYAQVLDVVAVYADAVLAEQPVLDPLALGVKQV